MLEILNRGALAQEFRIATTATSASGRLSSMMRATSSPVPTGTVDLVTTVVKPSPRAAAISRAAACT